MYPGEKGEGVDQNSLGVRGAVVIDDTSDETTPNTQKKKQEKKKIKRESMCCTLVKTKNFHTGFDHFYLLNGGKKINFIMCPSCFGILGILPSDLGSFTRWTPTGHNTLTKVKYTKTERTTREL